MNYRLGLTDKELYGIRGGRILIKLYKDGADNIIVMLRRYKISQKNIDALKNNIPIVKVKEIVPLHLPEDQLRELEGAEKGKSFIVKHSEDINIVLFKDDGGAKHE